MVSHHPTNKLIDREPTLHRKNLSHPPHARQTEHKVLNTLSGAYPKEKDRLLTCYSPVRHSHQGCKHPWIPFDLHVLSTPPAFILSQDQTLQQKPKTNPPKNSRQKINDSSQKTIQQKQTPTIKKQNVPKSSASKKQKTEKTKTPNQTARHPSQSHTNKTKKHTIENTNNQTTNQPNWPIRIRCKQKIIGGKLGSRRLRRSATNTKLPSQRPRVKPD